MHTIQVQTTMPRGEQKVDLRRLIAGLIVGLGILAALLSGCGSVEIGIEHVPTTNTSMNNATQPDWQATAETLQAEARQGEANSASPLPSPVPTKVPVSGNPGAVAYIQGGDLWLKELPVDESQRLVVMEPSDGKVVSQTESMESVATRLTHDGRNHSPRWSASGEWLSFLKGSDSPELWIVRRDGSDARSVTADPGEAFSWSPTVDAFAYAQNGAIYLLAPEIETPITFMEQSAIESADAPNSTVGRMAWSPDGEKLAFVWTAQSAEDGLVADGLWMIDRSNGTPVQLLEGNMPEQGEIILQGWSGDGQYLLYWQAPILSASILADGVPLYAISVQGGRPEVIADAILVHEDAVQSQIDGVGQVALVVGSGREMWHGKRLQAALPGSTYKRELTPMDQAVSSPVWSPDGGSLAYIGMPDVEGVSGGVEAQVALNQRRLWLVEEGNSFEPRPLTSDEAYRDESPAWIDNETLLLARLNTDGRASLWLVDKAGSELQPLVDELTPAPEWFGYYGYIDWRPLFAVWRPTLVERTEVPAAMTPTPVPYQLPTSHGHTLGEFLNGLHSNLTEQEALALWGEPDVVTGSGLILHQYALEGGVTLWLGFSDAGPLSYAQLQSPNGQRFSLTPLVEGEIEPVTIEGVINSPESGSSVGGDVEILGSAVHESFQKYELHYKLEPSDESAYIYFSGATTPVINGTLGTWMASGLPSGVYTLRLRIVRNNGDYAEYYAQNIRVNEERVATPVVDSALTPTVVPPTSIFLDRPTPVLEIVTTTPTPAAPPAAETGTPLPTAPTPTVSAPTEDPTLVPTATPLPQ